MTLARPYAKAAFELAQNDSNLAGWDGMLSAVAAVTADENMTEWLGSPFSTPDSSVDIILKTMGEEVDARFQGYLGVLADNDRLTLCTEISQMFGQLREDAEKHLTVRVVSAIALLDSEAEQIESALAKRFDREITLNNEIDPGVIGGAIIYAGDQVIDGSLLGRLNRLRSSLN